MVTIEEKVLHSLASADEISEYLMKRHSEMMETMPFQHGERVAIKSRAGIPPDLGVGSVAIWLFASNGGIWSHVLLLTAVGIETIAMVPTDNLGKSEPADGGEVQ